MRGYETRTYEGAPVGQLIQRTIGKGPKIVAAGILPALTFRVRRSNGMGGVPAGTLIQDRYPYFVPWPNAENIPDSTRIDFADAVAAWQALTLPEKKEYDAEAGRRHLNMSGYNLFIRKYRLGAL